MPVPIPPTPEQRALLLQALFHRNQSTMMPVPMPPPRPRGRIAGEEPEEVGHDRVVMQPYAPPQFDPYEPSLQERLARGQASAGRQYGAGSREAAAPPSRPPDLGIWGRIHEAIDPTQYLGGVAGTALAGLPLGPAIRAIPGAAEVIPQIDAAMWRGGLGKYLYPGKGGFTEVAQGAKPYVNAPAVEKAIQAAPKTPRTMTEELRAIHQRAKGNMPGRQPNVSEYSPAEKQRIAEAVARSRMDNNVRLQLQRKGELDAATRRLLGLD